MVMRLPYLRIFGKILLFLAILALVWKSFDTDIGTSIYTALIMLSPVLLVGYLVHRYEKRARTIHKQKPKVEKTPYIFSWKKVIRNWIIFALYISSSLALSVGLKDGRNDGLLVLLVLTIGIATVYLIGLGIYFGYRFLKKKFS